MASGTEHDKSTKFWSLPFALIVGLFLGLGNGIISGIAFYVGGLWLSPDLDIRSNSFNRWGPLKFFWWPYQKVINHRSIFSHGPFIGTAIRSCYILGIASLIKVILVWLGFSIPSISIDFLTNFLTKYPKESIAIFIGLEGSTWLHLIKDRDPWPN